MTDRNGAVTDSPTNATGPASALARVLPTTPRLDVLVAVVLLVGLVGGGVLIAGNQAATRDRIERRFVADAQTDAEFTAVAVADLARRQSVAATATLAGDVDDEALGAVAGSLGVGFALLFRGDGSLLAVHPSREVDAASLVESFPHIRQALDGTAGVSAALNAPTFPSGVAIAIAAPFTGVDGRRVLSTAFDRGATVLGGYLAGAPLTPNGRTWLIDDAGGVVAAGSDAASPPVVEGVDPGEIVRERADRSERTIVRLPVRGTPWWVVAAAPTSDLYSPVTGWNLWRPWALLLLAALGGVAVVMLLGRYRRAADQLAWANAELAAAAERTRDFVAIASHELRTPAAIVSGFAEGLVTMWPDLTENERADYSARMVRASRRLSHLLESLLTQALADREQLSLSITRIQVEQIVNDAIDACRLEPSQIRLDVDPYLEVQADALHLTRVLVNILDNASKYGAPPIDIAAASADGEVRIDIRDHGAGVPEAFAPRLFERFARASPAGDATGLDGAGLGLSVAYGIASQMRGTLEYQPALPGARFVLTLPHA